uniref:EF-hand domain-containing protein n=1 Tax=Hanusia phi TaxID=3032 RepID=A0A7S0E2X4_9CRYP
MLVGGRVCGIPLKGSVKNSPSSPSSPSPPSSPSSTLASSIPKDENAAHELLKQALDGDDGGTTERSNAESVLGDDDLGQGEGNEMAELVEDEKSFFLRTDEDGDSKLNLNEFLAHWRESMSYYEESESNNESSSHSILDSQDDEAGYAFKEFDENSDGFISWSEWRQMMFHETAQQPSFRDGEFSTEGSFDEKQKEKRLRALFKEWDKDQDGILSREESREMLKVLQSKKSADGQPHELTEDEIEMISWQLLDDKDTNLDNAITLEEWLAGESYF